MLVIGVGAKNQIFKKEIYVENFCMKYFYKRLLFREIMIIVDSFQDLVLFSGFFFLMLKFSNRVGNYWFMRYFNED